MITNFSVKNYKSILDDSIELSNVNVLIGENESGKTNYLEAMAMFSAANSNRLDISGLSEKGIRVTKPNLTLSSFLGKPTQKKLYLEVLLEDYKLKSVLTPINVVDIYSEWTNEYTKKIFDNTINRYVNLDTLLGGFVKKATKESQGKINTNINDKIKEKVLNNLNSLELPLATHLADYLIYNIDTQALRGINNNSKVMPLGIYGEGLDVLLNDFSKEEWEELMEYRHLFSWLDDIVLDKTDKLKFEGNKLGRSTSILYFRDKFMGKNNNVFAAENSNEGVLHILFYLALFISKKTPKFFAIDNIETALNPKLCRVVMKEIAALAIKHDKQVLITTHNPAILDGLNLHDDKQRLFVIKRTDEGYTKSERIKIKPTVDEKNLKLSEMWMRGHLGGLPTNF